MPLELERPEAPKSLQSACPLFDPERSRGGVWVTRPHRIRGAFRAGKQMNRLFVLNSPEGVPLGRKRLAGTFVLLF